MIKKSQSSLEFLVMLGISFLLILVLGGVFLLYSDGAKNQLDRKQINSIFTDITSNIEKIYFLGNGNRVTIKVNMPSNIINLSIVHSNRSNSTDIIELNYFNITVLGEGTYQTLIYEPNDIYVKFNCSKDCFETPNLNGNWTTYFVESDFSAGPKEIRIESKGSWVDVYFNK